jgi:hypothetical protein
MTISMRKTILARPSFTLTELIVVMAIMAIMMSMIAAAMSGAINDARKQRTAMIITKIDRLIMEKVNEYRFRSVRLQMAATTPPALQSRYRLYALRDLMRMELPDRYSDFVVLGAGNALVPVGPANLAIQEGGPVVSLQTTPAVTLGYLRQIQKNTLAPQFTKEFENAECLYLILSQMRDEDRTALANFSRDEIGDFDNDGMKEIWDGWGRPISFLRWAPGFVSNPPDWGSAPYVDDGGTVGANSGYPALTTQSIIQQNPGTGVSFYPELDQFESIDLLRLEPRWANVPRNPQGGSINWQWRPFALRPLIFSNGPDKQADIRLTYDAPNGATTFRYDLTGVAPDNVIARELVTVGNFRIPTDPYVLIFNGQDIEPWIGACYDTNGNRRAEYTDNITNHAIELGGESNQ